MSEYKTRWSKIFNKMNNSSLLILYSGKKLRRNKDVYYPFRPNSNFLYCLNLSEPHSVFCIYKNNLGEAKTMLFISQRIVQNINWESPAMDIDTIKDTYPLNNVYHIEDFNHLTKEIIDSIQYIYHDTNHSFINSNDALYNNKHLINANDLLSNLRLIKSDFEVGQTKFALKVTMEAHLKVMQKSCHNIYEHQLEACIMETFYNNGLRHFAYPSIVGGGENACILHYTDNDKVLGKDNLVLIDAGAEYNGYAADITRTIPVNGQFTSDQLSIYSIVLKAQKNAISLIKPGVTWDLLNKEVENTYITELLKLGILQGTYDDNVTSKHYKKYYPHSLGHWLGLDVHDAGEYIYQGEPRLFEKGMLLTIEPGLYMVPNENLDKKWHNIGVRIEDNILVTEDGCEVLSANLIKEAGDIESFMHNNG